MSARTARALLATVTLLFVTLPGTAAESGGDRVLEEVVVTATKRTESLEDVPISVGVVTGAMIEEFEIADLNDIRRLIYPPRGQLADMDEALEAFRDATSGDDVRAELLRAAAAGR